jgi:predicted flap endonuclease-1-like 5' DNA nuclease
MITLALQIFLLMLSAYLAGCMVGCILRRAMHEPKPVAATIAAALEVPAQPRPVALPADQSRFETALTGKAPSPVPVAPPGEPVVEVRPRPASTARDSRTAEIEIIKAPVAAPAAAVSVAAQSMPETPAEPSAQVAAEPEPLPPPPPPPPPMGAAQMASYAAVAAAAAAARAVVEAETASRSDRHSSTGPELDLEPHSEPEMAAAIDTITFVDVVPAPESEPAPAEPVEIAPPAEPQQAEPQQAEPQQAEPQQAEPMSVPAPTSPEPLQPGALAADDLKRIRGIDAGLQSRLNAQNIHRFADIASWSAADVTRMSQSLGVIGRIEQENWIEQAQILARGSDTEYSRRQRLAATTAAVGMAAATAAAAANALVQKSASPDRLTRIIGIEPATEKTLYELGVMRYSDIAQWTSSDIERVEAVLARPGRVGLDNWVEQARVLARYAGESELRPAAAPDSEPRPVRLADAIRENRASKAAEPAAPRTDIAGLRSVRSQALRGETPSLGDRVDDLKRIRGIGVLIEKRLNALGITSYEQVANWTKADIDSVSTQLDFKGRVERENWIEQARILASGGQTEFSRRVDRGEVETSKNN